MPLRSLLSPVAGILALLHLYIGARLLLPFGPLALTAGAIALAACFWFLPKGWESRKQGGRWVVLLPWITMGFFSWLLVLTVM
ncbi:MAG TPA: metallophosphoesterase, partial [Usitatibacter sp.]|nr:metallophosphoesterase [Usitatibacter sp.]